MAQKISTGLKFRYLFKEDLCYPFGGLEPFSELCPEQGALLSHACRFNPEISETDSASVGTAALCYSCPSVATYTGCGLAL